MGMPSGAHGRSPDRQHGSAGNVAHASLAGALDGRKPRRINREVEPGELEHARETQPVGPGRGYDMRLLEVDRNAWLGRGRGVVDVVPLAGLDRLGKAQAAEEPWRPRAGRKHHGAAPYRLDRGRKLVDPASVCADRQHLGARDDAGPAVLRSRPIAAMQLGGSPDNSSGS
jgi:hypothetical protein